MKSDEDQIREVVASWMAASKAGDVDAVLSLMTDDAVFLLPGRPPMHKADFAATASAQAGAATQIDGTSDIREIQIAGDWAFMWSRLTVVITPHGGTSAAREGHTLTIFRKERGKWRLARDANLLAPASPPQGSE